MSCLVGSSNSNNMLAKAVTVACFAWFLTWVLVGSTPRGKDWYGQLASAFFAGDDKGGTPVVAVAFPILISSTVIALVAVRRPEASPSSRTQRYNVCVPPQLPLFLHRGMRFLYGYGNASFRSDYDVTAFVFIFVPVLAYTLATIYRHLYGQQLSRDDRLMETGNAFGFAALISMGIALLPVARHGAFLKLFGWNPAAAIRLHVWSGRIVVFGTFIHGSFHLYRFKVVAGYGLLQSLSPPPSSCWNSNSDLINDCNEEVSDCSCYHRSRNLTGILASLGLLIILISSLGFVRRGMYAVFYKIHIVAGPFVLLMTIIHWNRSILYLAGGFLYYLASSIPVLIEQRHSYCSSTNSRQRPTQQQQGTNFDTNRGVQILSICRIPTVDATSSAGEGAALRQNERPCISITFAASDAAVSRFRPGQYVKLKLPELSRVVAHPFTVNLVPGASNQIRIIFRSSGPFTKRLANRLLTSASPDRLPSLYLDGYDGPSNRIKQAITHDVVIMVAGGIGITPYLSMLHRLYQHTKGNRRNNTTQKILLHWICRDASLIDYVKTEYFEPLLQQQHSSGCEVRIVIHNTSSSGKSDLGDGVRRVASYSDLHNPQDDDVEIIGRRDSGDIESDADTLQVGIPFSPSRFSPVSKASVASNMIFFGPFALTVWPSLTVIWYLYSHVQDAHGVLSRIWAPIAVVLLALAVGIGVNLFPFSETDSAEESDSPEQWTPVLQNKPSDEDNALEMSEQAGPSSSHSVPDATARVVVENLERTEFESGDETTAISLEELSKGRPSMHQLVSDLDKADRPALFVCGPASLMEDLRETVDARCSLRQLRNQCCRCSGGCCSSCFCSRVAFYEESFEI